MSADNGVYILRTKDKQYRVASFQNPEEMHYDIVDSTYKKEYTSYGLFKKFGDLENFTTNPEKAISIATALEEELSVCEYGIQIIHVDKTWKQIEKEYQLIGLNKQV